MKLGLTASLLLVLSMAWSAPAAPVPKDRKRKDYKDLIQGVWRVVGRESNNSPRSGQENCFWVFKDDNMDINYGSASTNGAKFTFKIDSRESPMHLDLFINGQHYQGLFELEGDTMKWANTGPGGARPTSFAPEANVYLIHFARN